MPDEPDGTGSLAVPVPNNKSPRIDKFEWLKLMNFKKKTISFQIPDVGIAIVVVIVVVVVVVVVVAVVVVGVVLVVVVVVVVGVVVVVVVVVGVVVVVVVVVISQVKPMGRTMATA